MGWGRGTTGAEGGGNCRRAAGASPHWVGHHVLCCLLSQLGRSTSRRDGMSACVRLKLIKPIILHGCQAISNDACIGEIEVLGWCPRTAQLVQLIRALPDGHRIRPPLLSAPEHPMIGQPATTPTPPTECPPRTARASPTCAWRCTRCCRRPSRAARRDFAGPDDDWVLIARAPPQWPGADGTVFSLWTGARRPAGPRHGAEGGAADRLRRRAGTAACRTTH